jgi:hypothetical protein
LRRETHREYPNGIAASEAARGDQTHDGRAKGENQMGDKSPKSIGKQATQKQTQNDKSNRQKQEAVFAKQSKNKKT